MDSSSEEYGRIFSIFGSPNLVLQNSDGLHLVIGGWTRQLYGTILPHPLPEFEYAYVEDGCGGQHCLWPLAELSLTGFEIRPHVEASLGYEVRRRALSSS